MSNAPERPHLSPSQIDTATRCPEAYRRSYVLGEKIPAGIQALKGTGLHGGAKTNFRQKIASHVDLPAKEIIDAAVATFDAETRGGYTLTDEESRRGAGIVLGEAKDQVAALARLLAHEVVPEYQPTHVEEKVRLLLPNATHDMLGILDIADDKNRVTDFKTTGRAKTQHEADHSPQLTFYAAAHRILTGKLPDEVRLEVLVKKKEPTRQTIISTRGPADFAALANRINAVLAMVNAGIFPPAPPGAWWCSPRWCGYWHSCPYVNSERKALAKLADDGKPLPEAVDYSDVLAASIAQVKVKRSPYKNPLERLLAENPACHRCGRYLTKISATLGHRVAVSEGGENTPDNLVLVCRGECKPVLAASAAGAAS